MFNVAQLRTARPILTQMFIILCTAAVIALVAALGLKLYFGSLEAGLAYLQSAPSIVQPKSLSLGTHAPGTVVKFTFEITNLTDRDGQISGASTSCGCVATRGLPQPLSAHHTTEVTGTLHVPQKEGYFEHQVVYYVDLGANVAMPATISGISRKIQ